MKRTTLFFLTTGLLFLFNGSEVMAESVPSLVPLNFYPDILPNLPLAWYPEADSRYCFIIGCRHFFYGPNIIAENGKYKMWTTINDMIFYFESTDGKTWTNGRTVMTAIQNNWENAGDCRTSDGETVCGGLSNPVVVKGVTPGWNYTMYYTGGPTINTQTNGGLGVAFSNDGINWTRFSGNPIRRFPGGGTFAANALKIGNKRYVFFYGGGNFAQNDSPPLKAAEDPGDGVHLGADITTFGGVGMPSKTAYPIAYDTNSNTCWYYYRDTWGNAGPSSFYIYKGSDCFNNLGTRIAVIDQGLTGNIGNGIAGAGIKERDGNGQVVSGTTSLQFYFGAGDAWAGWQPKSVTLGPSGEPPLGALNAPNCSEIFGWVLDKDDATVPVKVRLYYDAQDSGHFLGEILADGLWSGICAYHKLLSCNDKHKFSLKTPLSLKDGKMHAIYGVGVNLSGTGGSDAPLVSSPQNLTCHTDISVLRQFLAAFTGIFDYNQMARNFGK